MKKCLLTTSLVHVLKWEQQPSLRTRSWAALETGLDQTAFPAVCPFALEQALGE